MAWMHGRSTTAIGGLLASMLALGCAEGSGRSDDATSTTEPATSAPVTTFEPTTTIDPSDPTLTGTDDGSGTGSSTGSTSLDPDDSSDTTAFDDSSSSGGEAAPTVQSTDPAELQSGVPADATIEITFSEPMDPATVTTNAGSGCTGSVQVSTDGFGTCVPMSGAPVSGDDQAFVLTPAVTLASATPHQIRVLATVTDAGGTPMEADFTTPTGFIVRYFHTITIDGVDDFDAGEILPSSTAGHSARVAWDDTHLYLGMNSPDVGSGSSQVWMVAYVGGPAGTSQGVTYNTQSPAMPFNARWHVRWRTDGAFWGALEWTGAAWEDASFTIPPEDIASSGSFLELRVPWAQLGAPAYLDLHLGLLREEPFNEWSWAAVPDGSYTEGYDPDYGQFLQFDLAGSTLPADVLPM